MTVYQSWTSYVTLWMLNCPEQMVIAELSAWGARAGKRGVISRSFAGSYGNCVSPWTKLEPSTLVYNPPILRHYLGGNPCLNPNSTVDLLTEAVVTRVGRATQISTVLAPVGRDHLSLRPNISHSSGK